MNLLAGRVQESFKACLSCLSWTVTFIGSSGINRLCRALLCKEWYPGERYPWELREAQERAHSVIEEGVPARRTLRGMMVGQRSGRISGTSRDEQGEKSVDCL